MAGYTRSITQGKPLTVATQKGHIGGKENRVGGGVPTRPYANMLPARNSGYTREREDSAAEVSQGLRSNAERA